MTDAPNGPNWSMLERRVSINESTLITIREGIKETKDTQRELGAQILEVHRAVLAIGKPQYTVISGFAVVILAAAARLWGLAVKPINDDLARLYAQNKDLDTRITLIDANKASKDDVRGPMADIKARIEEFNAAIMRKH